MTVPDFKVVVRCLTFNHSNYIEETLNGFCIQQTDFPFVCTILDDASTDGEQEIIKHFLVDNFDLGNTEIVQNEETEDYFYTYAQHKKNRNCFFAVFYLKYNHYKIKKAKNYYQNKLHDPEYLAICEGDDYWADPLKLEKQVDFLENHQDYSICHTGFTYYYEDNKEFQESSIETQTNLSIINNNEDVRYAILDNNRYRIQTLTILVRYTLYLKAYEILKPYKGKFLMGDTQLWVTIVSLGRIHFIPESTGVYRIHKGSACRPCDFSKRIRFDLSCDEMRVTMAKHFLLPDVYKEKFYHQYYKQLAKYYLFDRDYKKFIDEEYCTLKEKMILNICRSLITNNLLRKIYVCKSKKGFAVSGQ